VGFEKMKGAIVFLAVFVVVFLISLGATSIPPGQALYNLLKLPIETTTYKVGGAIYGDVLIKAIFNAVVYGVIVWLVFTIVTYRSKKENPKNIQQNVTVNVGDKDAQVNS
jgi:heme/copper-type cytochrome/quinol oxidase subunit 2